MTVPFIFQQAGWLPAVLAFIVIALMSIFASLYICEAMTQIPGNEHFESNVEFANLGMSFFGKHVRKVLDILFFVSMQTLSICSVYDTKFDRRCFHHCHGTVNGQFGAAHIRNDMRYCDHSFSWMGVCERDVTNQLSF